MEFHNRRVVIGLDDQGREAVLSDGPAPGTVSPGEGPAFATVLWVDHQPRSLHDGGDPPTGPFKLQPPPGGVCARLIRLPPPPPDATDDERWLRVAGDDPQRPGMHTTDTLDLMVVVEGEIVLGLDDGEHHFGAGEVAVQRGTAHRWRVVGDRPCTYAVTMLRPEPTTGEPKIRLAPRHDDDAEGAPRRVVTGTEATGASRVTSAGSPPVVLRPGNRPGSMMADLWQTGGPLGRVDQGGDVEGEWELDPVGTGVAFRMVEWPPNGDPGARGWHATSSIDIDFILSGHLELELRHSPMLHLGPGDVVVQRGAEHLWRPVGDERVRMAAVMISI